MRTIATGVGVAALVLAAQMPASAASEGQKGTKQVTTCTTASTVYGGSNCTSKQVPCVYTKLSKTTTNWLTRKKTTTSWLECV